MARQTKNASPRPRPRFLPRVDEVLCDCLGGDVAVGDDDDDDDDVGGVGDGFIVMSERLLVSILSLDLFCTDQQNCPSIAGNEVL